MQLRTQLTLAAGLFLLAPVVLFFSIDFLRDRVVNASHLDNVHELSTTLYHNELRRVYDDLETSFSAITTAVQTLPRPLMGILHGSADQDVSWPEMQSHLEELVKSKRNLSLAMYDQDASRRFAAAGRDKDFLNLALEEFTISEASGTLITGDSEPILAVRRPGLAIGTIYNYVAATPVSVLGRQLSHAVDGAVFISFGPDIDPIKLVTHGQSSQFRDEMFAMASQVKVTDMSESTNFTVKSENFRGFASRFPLVDMQGSYVGNVTIVRDTTDETIREEKQDRLVYGGFTVLILASIVLLLWFFNRSFRPLRQIIEALKALTNQDFDWELPRLNRRDELGLLADTLHDYRDSLIDRERLEDMSQKMEFAAEIQRSILPSTLAVSDFIDVEASMLPAEEIGGDFYDYFQMPDGRTAIVVADVADKGPGSALFGALAGAMIRTTSRLFSSPAEIITAVNNQLGDRNEAKLFVTLFFGIFDPKTGQLTYCNAGHEPPFVMKAPRPGQACRIEKLEQTKGIPLGLVVDCGFEEKTYGMNIGDSVVLYTDGITEATNEAGVLYSRDRLEGMLGQMAQNAPDQVMKNILDAVNQFAGNSGQADDITLLIASVTALEHQEAAPVGETSNVKSLEAHKRAVHDKG